VRTGRDDCGGPAGGEDDQRTETRRKSGEPDEHDQPPAALEREREKSSEHDSVVRIGWYGIPQPVFLQLIVGKQIVNEVLWGVDKAKLRADEVIE
jgi:hypothetical protein